MNLSCRPDRGLIRTAYRSNRFVLVEVDAPTAPRRADRDPLHVSFVLDRSGSMAGRKIAFAKEAITQAMSALHDEDRFSVVAYDDRIDVVVDSRPADDAGRRDALRRIATIDARGSTNLFEGWMRGAQQVAEHQRPRDVDRVLLLSDGLANVGITDPAELERQAFELRVRGIRTETFGVGQDFDEKLLERMAVAGGGHAYFIEEAAQIRDFIASAIGEALDVVARDAQLVVSAAQGVLVEPIGLFSATPDADGTIIELGDLVSGQRLEIVLRLNFPYGEAGRSMRASFGLRDRDGALAAAPVELTWAYADDRANDLQPRDRDVDRAVARRFAARARQAALDLNRAGRFDAAARQLQATARRIRSYAAADPELMLIAQALDGERVAFSAPMAAMRMKETHFRASYEMRGRDALGKALKRED